MQESSRKGNAKAFQPFKAARVDYPSVSSPGPRPIGGGAGRGGKKVHDNPILNSIEVDVVGREKDKGKSQNQKTKKNKSNNGIAESGGRGTQRGGGKVSTSSSRGSGRLRELESTPVLSWYWCFWHRGSSGWEVFLDGSKGSDFKGAKKNENSTHLLKEKPGVYEFSLVHPSDMKKRFKVYAGMTSNMLQRHHRNYRSNGSHLLKQFEGAVREGYLVLRRVKYTKSTEKAKALESRMLRQYNYAWNSMENGSKRDVHLQPNHCCCLCCRFQVSVSVLQP